MKVGFSFGRCVRDIVNGTVDINDVVVIVTRTFMKEEHIEGVIGEYMYVPSYLKGLDRDECVRVGKELYQLGKLHQPRQYGIRGVRINSDHVWMDLFPTKVEDHDAIKEAWEAYRLILKLSTDVPQAPEAL